MASNTLRLVVVTPDRDLVDQEVEKVALHSTEGGIEVFYDHEPVVFTLGIGPLSFRVDEKEQVLAVSGGFVEVQPDRVMVISDAAEWPHEIDIERAKKARERAEQRLAQKNAEINIARAEAALSRSRLRLELGKRD